MGASFQYDLAPGVVVRMFEHVLAQRPCTSFVTLGLRAFGQREIVITFLRHAQADPFPLLRTIAGLAQQGRIVGAGDITEVGPAGLFGQPNLRGLAYETAWPMDGVDLPPDCLHAIVLVGPEMDAVKKYGVLRVLARLGEANRFFPTTVWIDPARAPVAGVEKSILDGVASAHFAGVSAIREGNVVRVRLQRQTVEALQKSGLPPPEAALAFFAELGPTADACLVWTPGQQQASAIAAPGSTGARVAGCFALFVPQQAQDSAQAFEDGYVAMLTDASWARVRASLTSGAPFSNGSLAIEIQEPRAPAANVPAVSEMKMHLREAQADIEARLGMDELVAYANAVERTVQAAFAGQQGRGSVLEIEVVLAAGLPPRVRCSDASIAARIMALGSPPVRHGELAFRGSFDLFGGTN